MYYIIFLYLFDWKIFTFVILDGIIYLAFHLKVERRFIHTNEEIYQINCFIINIPSYEWIWKLKQTGTRNELVPVFSTYYKWKIHQSIHHINYTCIYNICQYIFSLYLYFIFYIFYLNRRKGSETWPLCLRKVNLRFHLHLHLKMFQ